MENMPLNAFREPVHRLDLNSAFEWMSDGEVRLKKKVFEGRLDTMGIKLDQASRNKLFQELDLQKKRCITFPDLEKAYNDGSWSPNLALFFTKLLSCDHFFDPNNLEPKEMSVAEIQRLLENTRGKWPQRIQAMRDFVKKANKPKISDKKFDAEFRKVKESFCLQLKDRRSAVARDAAICLGKLAIIRPNEMTRWASRLLQVLFECARMKVEVISMSADDCIRCIVKHVPDSKRKYPILSRLIEGAQDSNVDVRRFAMGYITICVDNYIETSKSFPKPVWTRVAALLTNTKHGIADADQQVRFIAYTLLARGELAGVDEAQNIVSSLIGVTQRTYLEQKDALICSGNLPSILQSGHPLPSTSTPSKPIAPKARGRPPSTTKTTQPKKVSPARRTTAKPSSSPNQRLPYANADSRPYANPDEPVDFAVPSAFTLELPFENKAQPEERKPKRAQPKPATPKQSRPKTVSLTAADIKNHPSVKKARHQAKHVQKRQAMPSRQLPRNQPRVPVRELSSPKDAVKKTRSAPLRKPKGGHHKKRTTIDDEDMQPKQLRFRQGSATARRPAQPASKRAMKHSTPARRKPGEKKPSPPRNRTSSSPKRQTPKRTPTRDHGVMRFGRGKPKRLEYHSPDRDDGFRVDDTGFPDMSTMSSPVSSQQTRPTRAVQTRAAKSNSPPRTSTNRTVRIEVQLENYPDCVYQMEPSINASILEIKIYIARGILEPDLLRGKFKGKDIMDDNMSLEELGIKNGERLNLYVKETSTPPAEFGQHAHQHKRMRQMLSNSAAAASPPARSPMDSEPFSPDPEGTLLPFSPDPEGTLLKMSGNTQGGTQVHVTRGKIYDDASLPANIKLQVLNVYEAAGYAEVMWKGVSRRILITDTKIVNPRKPRPAKKSAADYEEYDFADRDRPMLMRKLSSDEAKDYRGRLKSKMNARKEQNSLSPRNYEQESRRLNHRTEAQTEDFKDYQGVLTNHAHVLQRWDDVAKKSQTNLRYDDDSYSESSDG